MKIKGKDEFLAQIGRLPQAIREEVRKALTTSAQEATDLMQRFAPVEQGKLRASIDFTFGEAPEGSLSSTSANARAAKGEAGLSVTMFAGDESTIVTNSRGVRFQNARLQEFGTANMARNPFFFPAYRLTRKRAKSRLQRSVRNGAKKAFGK